MKPVLFIFAAVLSALTACGKTDAPHTPPATASSAAVAEDAPAPAENTVQTLISKDNKINIVVANGHFSDVSPDAGSLPENVSAEEMTLLQYDGMLGITLYADNLGPAQTDAKTYFANLKNELQSAEGLTDVQVGIATDNRMNYRFSQTTAGGILNENCIAIHETNLYNVCANSNTASQEELASVLKEVSLIKQTD